MQVDPVFTKAFTVVGHIEQRRDHPSFGIHAVDQPGQRQIGEGDGIVIGVHDLFAGAIAELCCLASGREDFLIRRIAQPVAWAVAADLVQHDDGILRHRRGHLFQVFLEHLIRAFRIAEFRPVLRFHHARRYPVGDVLVAGVVVPPFDVEPGALQHVQQVFVLKPALIGIVRHGQGREHAGQRSRRRRAATGGIAVIDDVALGQFGVRLFRIPIQRPACRATGLPGSDHDQHRLFGLGKERARLGIGAGRLHDDIGRPQHHLGIAQRTSDRGQRLDRGQKLFLFAQDRLEGLQVDVQKPRHRRERPRRAQNPADQPTQEAWAADLDHQNQNRRQNPVQRHMHQEIGRDQVLGFGESRRHRILDHLAIDHRTQHVGVIGTDRRDHDEGDQHRLVQPAHGKDRNGQIDQEPDGPGKDQAKRHPPLEDPDQMAPERVVAQRQKIGRDDRVQKDGRK